MAVHDTPMNSFARPLAPAALLLALSAAPSALASRTRQSSRNPLTELTLRGGRFGACRAGRGSAAVLGGRRVRRLFGAAKGRFRSRGRYSSATVRGTEWTVEDRCEGTLTKGKRGSVAVRDFAAGRTVMVRAGRRTGRSGGRGTYLAGPRR